MADRAKINEESLDQIVGGYMNFNYHTNILTYTHEETNAVTKYQIKNFEKAWKRSNELHAQNLHEDKIIADLLSHDYIV
jgi:hypothetical protein